MRRESLDQYDTLPEEMTAYLKHYGRHFNNKLLAFALEKMQVKNSLTGVLIKATVYSKEKVDLLLKQYNIKLDNNELNDYIYVANMCKADFLGKSVPDEHHLALYIKDVIDDPDGYDGIVFNRWYADMCRKGIPIEWENML